MKESKFKFLFHPTLGKRKFEHGHAMRILALSNNGGWVETASESDANTNNENQGDPGKIGNAPDKVTSGKKARK